MNRVLSILSSLGLVLVILVCGSSVSAQENQFKDYTDGLNIPDVVVRVNGVGVRSDYVVFKFNRVMARGLAGLSERPDADQAVQRAMTLNERKKVVIDVIDKEIVRELMFQEAKKRNLIADPKLVEAELGRLKKAYGSETNFKNAMKARSLSVKGLKSNIKIDILIQQLIRGHIKGKIQVNDEDVKNFYEKFKEKFRRPESYRTRHIFIPHFTKEMLKDTPRDKLREKMDEFSAKAKANMENILLEVKAGGDFTKLAKKYSQDAGSAKKGGELEFIYKGIFDPAFDDAVAKLKPKEISDVVRTQYGYHIIQLLETKLSDLATFKELEESIQKQLVVEEGKKHLQAYTDILRKNATIEMFY